MDFDFDKKLIDSIDIDSDLNLTKFSSLDDRHIIIRYVYKKGKFSCERRYLNSVSEKHLMDDLLNSINNSADFLKFMGLK